VINVIVICGWTDRTNKVNNIGGDSIMLGIAESSATKGGREVEEREIERG
jgi:hypothetical protein